MIAVKLEGRLGNQLFQYAFIYAAAKKLNTAFYIDKSSYDFILPQYFDNTSRHLSVADKFIFSIKGYKNLFSFHAKVAYYNFSRKIHGLKTLTFTNDIEPVTQRDAVQDKTLYLGFFQSVS